MKKNVSYIQRILFPVYCSLVFQELCINTPLFLIKNVWKSHQDKQSRSVVHLHESTKLQHSNVLFTIEYLLQCKFNAYSLTNKRIVTPMISSQAKRVLNFLLKPFTTQYLMLSVPDWSYFIILNIISLSPWKCQIMWLNSWQTKSFHVIFR